MVLVEFLGQLFQVVNGPGTTPQGTLALRKAPSWAGTNDPADLAAAMTGPQLNALITMASWAENNLNNETGTTTLNGRTVPRAAARMHAEFNNADFGGRTRQEQRREQKAERMDIADIEAAARERGVTIGGGR